MELNTLINAGIGVLGLIVTNYAVKLGRVYPLLKKAIQYARDEAEARKDGLLTQKEKSKLYDDLELIVREAWSILKGFTFFKSK